MGSISHSALGASGAYRWMNCPGSVALCADLPESSSKAADEGSAAHAWAEWCLINGEVDCNDYIGCTQYPNVFTEEWARKGHPLTKEMADAINVYLTHVWETVRPEDELHVERRVSLRFIAEEMFGTCDCAILKPSTGTLHVIDYKHGAGVVVDVKDNPQAKYYAVGMLDAFSGAGITKVITTIVQPRAGGEPVKTCEYDTIELMEWAYGELRPAALATRKPDAPLVAGDHCKFCGAKGFCQAFRGRARAAALDGLEIITPAKVPTLPADDMAARLAELPLLKSYIAALEDYAKQEARAGRMPRGFKWVAGLGARQWTDSETAVAFTVKERTGADITERVTLSPTQAERVLGKKIFAEKCSDLVTRKMNAPSLVPESDKRPAISLDDVKNASALAGMEALE